MNRKEMKMILSSRDIKDIAEETGYSRGLIYAWFRGDRNNVEIEAKVLEKVAAILERTKELKERIKSAL